MAFPDASRIALKPAGRRVDLRLVGDKGAFPVWMRDQGYSHTTVELYASATARAARWLKERGLTLGQAKADDVYAYWMTVPPTRGSRNRVRSALIAYYKYRGKKDGGVAAELPSLPEPLSLPRARSDEDHTRFVQAARSLGGEHAALGALLAFTGCRIGEAEKARWHQFDLWSAEPSWFIEGKGSRKRGPKVRKVDLCGSAVLILLNWRVESKSADWVFPSTQSLTGHLGQTSLRKRVADICEVAEIDPATPHVWRHTVATIALDRSRDIRALQELLGHSSLATTQVYTRVLPGRLKALVETLEDL